MKPVVLCVDDTPSVLEGEKMLLEEKRISGPNRDQRQGRGARFPTHSVDLVLLDYHTPEMNGDIAAARMKDSKPDVPVALLSSDECLPWRDLEAADYFIPKSEPVVRLLEKVDYLLSLRFLFLPFDALKALDQNREGSDGISMKNVGIQKTL